MKANKVSALRSKRGLHRVNGAEPPVVGLAPQTTNDRKADTMKTYILLKSEPVQSQIITAPAGAKPLVLFVGLDVHNDSIAVSLAPSDSTEVRRYGIIGGEHGDVLKLAKKVAEAQAGRALKFCDEAGPRGFALCRCLQAHGWDCAAGVLPTFLRRP